MRSQNHYHKTPICLKTPTTKNPKAKEKAMERLTSRDLFSKCKIAPTVRIGEEIKSPVPMMDGARCTALSLVNLKNAHRIC